jgi:hypothetical protein
MAPMMTAALFVNKPRVAIMQEVMTNTRKFRFKVESSTSSWRNFSGGSRSVEYLICGLPGIPFG